MDNLITLIFIIIAVLSLLGKIQSKKRTGAGSSDTGGWIAKLNKFLADVQNQMEQQAKEKSSNSSGWDELMDNTHADDELYDSDEYSLEDLELEDDQHRLGVKKEMPAPTSPVQPLAVRSDDSVTAAPEALPQSVLRAGKSVGVRKAKDRKALRKAIVWSEILGPPVSLRDTHGHPR